MRRRACAALLIFIFVLTACSDKSLGNEAKEATSEFFAMNTYITMTVYGDLSEEAVLNAKSRIESLEELWSVTDENSEIYAINHSNGTPVAVSEETAELISFALDMADKTGGALEPTIYPVLAAWGFTTDEHRVSSAEEISSLMETVDYHKVILSEGHVAMEPEMMIDMGAIAKGYAGDLACELLKSYEISSALINLGGNVQAIGARPDGSDWRIELRNPLGEGGLGILSVSDCAVVTSGNYENYFTDDDGNVYGHIIDPSTGYPVDNGLASVTIVADKGKKGDALSTSLFVMGYDEAVSFWKANQGFDMILVDEDGKIAITQGIAGRFEPYDSVNSGDLTVLTR